MKAVVKYELGPQGVAMMDIPQPIPAEGELKVKVLACGICGSDIHALHDSGGRKVNMPCVLGHEFVGQVVSTGGGDCNGFAEGDWVTALPACYSCGECELCKQGLVTLCRDRKSVGTHRNGGMAEYVVVPSKYAFRIPANAVTLEDKKLYALAEPFCCVVRGVYERVDVKPGDVALVSGPGPMGMMAVMALKARGAYVIVSGLPADSERLALCKELGADEVYDNFDSVKEAIYRKNSYGANITCDITAVPPAVNGCFSVLAPLGTHLEIGLFSNPPQLDMEKLFLKEANYVPTNSTSVGSWKIGLKLMEEGKVNLKPLMNYEVPIEDWAKGFEATIKKEKYKVIINPGCFD